jgi:hypothetical protein
MKNKTIEELRTAFKTETDPQKKKAIASEALGGKVCYWENCTNPWHKDITAFCSQEHYDLYKNQNPSPEEKRRLTIEEIQKALKLMAKGRLSINTLDETPRQVADNAKGLFHGK